MRKKILSVEDSALFRETIGDVVAVESDAWLLKPPKKLKPVPRKRAPLTQDYTPYAVDIIDEKLTAEDTMSFVEAGLQKNILLKLRQGYFEVDAEFDLHGLTSAEAKQQLWRFLQMCVEDGCRCVHIIHGKGYRSKDNYPILKNHLNNWLRQHNEVQAFCSALPKDGGAGAVLVLLHLSKKYAD